MLNMFDFLLCPRSPSASYFNQIFADIWENLICTECEDDNKHFTGKG